jgi:hypothetical protein
MFYNKTLLDVKSKIEKQLRQDKEKYEIDKQKFYADPKHWDNNKRKRAGLHMLRSDSNKYRNKKFRCFRVSQELFEMVDNFTDEYLKVEWANNRFFNRFVELKDLQTDNTEGEYTYETSSIF